ncbi:hypothetical protein CDV31_004249 [Fusarium ambrosium]|uniref:Isochorismatase-like domain-containing protein n=1 Tax=Fusarium ambrosium TaxID=131363 RepID=A0A428URK2_9HYPO|nr:hypothetical protein CDV31_004249 [Fusarium ambrosium]
MTDDKTKVIGGKNNFWLWSEETGFDLTHPDEPSSPPVYHRLSLTTSTEQVTIDPTKTALVVVDMQNYFLSPLLGRPYDGPGLIMAMKLEEQVIPACRRADIPIIWVGWGLDEADLDNIPPPTALLFTMDNNFEDNPNEPKYFGALGEDIGLQVNNDTSVEAGKVMMRDQWNTALFPTLKDVSLEKDKTITKKRPSGFWGGTGIEEHLAVLGITTLLFAGVNTHRGLEESIRDASNKGWDCLLVSDEEEGVEKQCERDWGFVLTSEQFIDGVHAMQAAPECLDAIFFDQALTLQETHVEA